MGVPIETALRWEQRHEYQTPEGCDLPPALRELVDHHFATARTKGWDARLKEYWDLNRFKIQDTEKYGDYRWIEFTPADLETAHVIKPDTFSLYGPKHAEERNPTSYQLRSTIHMCKKTRRDEFHGFMDLPIEIRDMVYRCALLKGKVIVPNSRRATMLLEPVKYLKSDDGYDYVRYKGLSNEPGPARGPLGLVQGVSRAVHDGAAEVYFSGNQFVFPAGEFVLPSFCNVRDGLSPSRVVASRGRSRLTNNAPLLRDVSYTFDMRDHPTDDYSNLYANFYVKDSIDGRTISPAEALQALHDAKALELEIDWAERVDSIKRMTLDRLVLDFEECYCAVGCCRKVGWVLDRFLHEGPPPGTQDTEGNAYSSVDWFARPPLVVEVRGFRSHEEKLMALRKLVDLRSEICYDRRVGKDRFNADVFRNLY